jgi:hypothetical protein
LQGVGSRDGGGDRGATHGGTDPPEEEVAVGGSFKVTTASVFEDVLRSSPSSSPFLSSTSAGSISNPIIHGPAGALPALPHL